MRRRSTMNFFADAAGEAARGAANWNMILALGVLLAIAVNIAALLRGGKKQEREIGPQPFEVRAAAEFARQHDFAAHVAADQTEHAQIFAKLGGVERGLRAELKSDMAGVQSELKQIRGEIGGLTTATEIQNQQLTRMETKMDRKS